MHYYWFFNGLGQDLQYKHSGLYPLVFILYKGPYVLPISLQHYPRISPISMIRLRI